MAAMVRKLTVAQKDSLMGQKANEHTFFNPVKDLDGEWIISEHELDLYFENHGDRSFLFINDLPLKVHQPVFII